MYILSLNYKRQRRKRDSNSRYKQAYNCFQDSRYQPLSHFHIIFFTKHNMIKKMHSIGFEPITFSLEGYYSIR